MANLFLTDMCERGCAFCFAKEGSWDETYRPRPLSLDEVAEFASIGSLNGRTERGVLGGEPLQYAKLPRALELLWDKGLSAKVFTSGVCPMPAGLAELDIKGGLHFVVNIAPRESYPPAHQECLNRFLEVFGCRSSLSYTIADPDLGMAFLLDYIAEHSMLKRVRVGVAVPMVGGGNRHASPERYRDVAMRLLEFSRQAAPRSVTIGMDCGFVACMFTSDEIGALLRSGAEAQFTCSPAQDTGPGLECWHCFPLAKLPRVEEENATRRRNAGCLRARLAEIDGIDEVAYEPEQTYYSFMFKYDARAFGGAPKRRFTAALAAEGINRQFSSPSNQVPAYRSAYFNPNGRDYSAVSCPVAERAFAHEAIGISGTDVLLGDESDMDQIAEAILKIQANAGELAT